MIESWLQLLPKRILALILVVFFGPTAMSEDTEESDIDRPARETYRIVLFPPPGQLKPPEGMEGRDGRMSDTGSIYVPAPTTSAGLRDMYRLNLYRIYPSKPIGPQFSVESDIYKLIDQVDAASNWRISEVVEYPFYDDSTYLDMRRIQAEDELSKTVASGVVYLEFVFLLGRRLDHLRVVVNVGVYERQPRSRRPSKKLKLRYQYFSPSRGVVLRPWHEGEKEAIIASINARYDEKLARWPHNKKAYKKDRRSELSAIKKRDVIYEETAIEEGWSAETIVDVLHKAIEHLTPFILSDLGNFEPNRSKPANSVSFEYVNWSGTKVNRAGTVIERTDGQIVYRDKNGHVYSMPVEQ